MPKKGANINLKGYDDLFSTEESRAEAQQERVQEIPLSELHPFEGHPFRVVDDEEMAKTVESVKEYGVLTPAIVRPDPYGGYEINCTGSYIQATYLNLIIKSTFLPTPVGWIYGISSIYSSIYYTLRTRIMQETQWE